MILTYEQLLREVEMNGLKSISSKVKSIALGVFEPLDHVRFTMGFKSLSLKPFSAKIQNVPLVVQGEREFILTPTTLSLDDAMNTHFPGDFIYGGAFVLEDLLNHKPLDFRVFGYPTDLMDRQELRKNVTVDDLYYGLLDVELRQDLHPLAYVNSADHIKFTENGAIKNNLQAINFRTSGLLQTIIKLEDRVQDVFMAGTSGTPSKLGESVVRFSGDFLRMDTLYASGLSLKGYGVMLALGLGALIRVDGNSDVLEEIISNEERLFKVLDVASQKEMARIPFKRLRDAAVVMDGQSYKVGSLTSLYLAERIARRLAGQE
jgi:uncharacterized protein (DUF39 family)